MVDLNALPEDDGVEEEYSQVDVDSGGDAEDEAEAEEAEEAEAEAASASERPETALEIYHREREERIAKMKRKRESSGAQPSAKMPPAKMPTIEHRPAEDRERTRALASLPEGWLDCPSLGEPIGRFIPSKVPLGEHFNGVIEAGKRYSWKHVLQKHRASRRELALVIDLTFTTRYYSSIEVERGGVKHIKIACRGRNEVPDNESVNRFVYEAHKYLLRKPKAFILVHCTHGFNRTGFMIINYLVRQLGRTVEQAVREFAEARSPGIYKRDYIQSLYRFYHERVAQPITAPPTPEWKRPLDLNGEAKDDDDDDDADAGTVEVPKENVPMTIDDVLGDPVPMEQQCELQRLCYQFLGQAVHPNRDLGFPGSQPVSLDRKHMQHLRQRYYYITWKADGTRYMMLIQSDGCYLIDRKFNFRRLQMRFPPKVPLRDVQDFTLLDGEMVIDTDKTKELQTRRYLVYDLMVLHSKPLLQQPFSVRWQLIEQEVIEPRRMDAQNNRYNYDEEPFRVRRKDFWPLSTTEKILNNFIPNQVSHESDGLIFQGRDDPYVCKTHQGLLKWKFAHLNSVDFLLKYSAERGKYCLILADRSQQRVLEGASITFEGKDPAALDNKIIECSWRHEEQTWVFLRERVDKDRPNAWSTYTKVMESINDNITKEVLLQEIKQILALPMYRDRDRAAAAAGRR